MLPGRTREQKTTMQEDPHLARRQEADRSPLKSTIEEDPWLEAQRSSQPCRKAPARHPHPCTPGGENARCTAHTPQKHSRSLSAAQSLMRSQQRAQGGQRPLRRWPQANRRLLSSSVIHGLTLLLRAGILTASIFTILSPFRRESFSPFRSESRIVRPSDNVDEFPVRLAKQI